MHYSFECFNCNVRQAVMILDMLDFSFEKKQTLMRNVLKYLSEVDYNKSNPEIMAGTWQLLVADLEDQDIYQAIKRHYNKTLLDHKETIKKQLATQENAFQAALKTAISGNLIDFAAGHEFDIDMLFEILTKVHVTELAIDDSSSLYKSLKNAKMLLYLGDNCGEIVLDTIFVEYLRKEFPELTIYYAVRGYPVINDNTQEDAKFVGMDKIANLISNGDNSLGTVLERTSTEFKKHFRDADVIISKGQGNFESLLNEKRNDIFFLFMVKCKPLIELLKVPLKSIVCLSNLRLKDSVN